MFARRIALVPTLLASLGAGLDAADGTPPPPPPLPAPQGAPQPSPPGPAQEPIETVQVIGELNQARNQITPSLGASTYSIGSTQIQDESQGDETTFNQVMLRMPGMAQDQYEQVHLRGEHANIQFRINGVLLPEGLITFGQEIDTHFADQVTLITGTLPAEYGLRTAGVLDITTKTGAIHPGGEVSAYGGSDQELRTSAGYGGTVGHVDAYASASAFHSSLGIDNPTSSWRAIHDDTNQERGFAYASYLIDSASRVSVFASVSADRFEIPNVPGQAPSFTLAGAPAVQSADLDEVQDQDNSYAVVAYQAQVGRASLQVAPYVRESHLVFNPDPVGDLEYTGVASAIDRTTLTGGVQLDSSMPMGESHTVRSGAAYSATRAHLNSDTLAFPVDSTGAQTSTTPTEIVDNHAETGSFYSLYLQDEWRLTTAWTVNYGLRGDAVQAFVDQQQVSPRINTTLVLGGTSIHAGYSRFFTPPPLEDVRAETVAKFAGTSNQSEVTDDSPIKSERANYFDAGISQRIGAHVQVGLDGYYKRATDQLDEGQFGTAIILTPFNYRQGRIMGGELTTSFADEGWSAYGNLALSEAQGKDIDSGQFLFGSAELAYAQSHWIYLDHDQRWTSSAGVSYRFSSGTAVSVDGIFGTGLRDGFDNTTHLPVYATCNVGASQAWRRWTARVDVINVFDRTYQIRDGSGVGVAAPSYGQRRSVEGGVKVTF